MENSFSSNTIMKKNCYWYSKVINGEEVMKACCVECNNPDTTSFFWYGEELGYGDYDLFCSKCNEPICIRAREQ